MKKIFLLFLFLGIPVAALAQGCSPSGYSVETINGVFTDESGAITNKQSLEAILPDVYKGQTLKVDYLLNPTHIAGFGDIVESAVQKIFDNSAVNDYDFLNMLSDASHKITTQKVLLVAHSQGNFYANSFYDTVTTPSPSGRG